MADKTYRMTVSLSDGSTVDAGTFVAPQGPQGPEGPQGPQGPAGGPMGNWVTASIDTELESGKTYIVKVDAILFTLVALFTMTDFINALPAMVVGVAYKDNGVITEYSLDTYTIKVNSKKLVGLTTTQLKFTENGGNVTGINSEMTFVDLDVTSFQYIKLD